LRQPTRDAEESILPGRTKLTVSDICETGFRTTFLREWTMVISLIGHANECVDHSADRGRIAGVAEVDTMAANSPMICKAFVFLRVNNLGLNSGRKCQCLNQNE
jgi:hypothetical protein